jgi:hypothetical protein
MNQVVELKCNYPPLPSSHRKTIRFYSPLPHDHELRLPPRAACRPSVRDASPPPEPILPTARDASPTLEPTSPPQVSVSMPPEPSLFSTESHPRLGHLRADGAPPEFGPSPKSCCRSPACHRSHPSPSSDYITPQLDIPARQCVSVPNPRGPPSLLRAAIKLRQASSSDLP